MSENKHTKGDLAQMQSLPLSIKISMTKRRIRDWYDYWDGNVFVSFSGGKAKIEKYEEYSYIVRCTKCPCDIGRQWYSRKQDAKKAWNRRAENA